MNAQQDNSAWVEEVFSKLDRRPAAVDELGRRQTQTAELISIDTHRRNIRNSREELKRERELHTTRLEKYSEDLKAARKENSIRGWMPVAVGLGTLSVILSYFYILILSGTVGNDFQLDAAVLSSVGVSVVGGSLALIGYVLRGLFNARKTDS
ncbi:MAG: hypothetical protein OIF58_05235 [Cohaesibacter sp.]|nr:hypothetical protein [Cohaesibacter sp.]